jgi:hypothetical protein
MQCAEGRQRDARRTDLQTGAIDGVKLPSRQDRHSAGRQLHVHDITGYAAFALNTTHAPPVQRMPPIMDYDFLPDISRMTARLRSIARTLCLPATISARRTGPASLRLLKPASSTASTRKPTSQTYSPSSSISGPRPASTVSGLGAPPRARPDFRRYWRSFADFGRRLHGNFHA